MYFILNVYKDLLLKMSLGSNLGNIHQNPLNNLEKKHSHRNIEFSNTNKTTHRTKNFVALSEGFPLRNKEFNIIVKQKTDTENALALPLFKTDNNGIMYILMNPKFSDAGEFNKDKLTYQPLKFSKRLGYVVKDINKNQSINPFYRSKFISKYLDLGISEYFLRRIVKLSLEGNNIIDGSKNSAINNWYHSTISSSPEEKKEYRDYNSHTERTQKALEYSHYISNAGIGVGGLALIAGSIIAQ